MASLSNSTLQNRKEHPNRSTNNGDMVEKDKRDVVKSMLYLSNYREDELIKTNSINFV